MTPLMGDELGRRWRGTVEVVGCCDMTRLISAEWQPEFAFCALFPATDLRGSTKHLSVCRCHRLGVDVELEDGLTMKIAGEGLDTPLQN